MNSLEFDAFTKKIDAKVNKMKKWSYLVINSFNGSKYKWIELLEVIWERKNHFKFSTTKMNVLLFVIIKMNII